MTQFTKCKIYCIQNITDIYLSKFLGVCINCVITANWECNLEITPFLKFNKQKLNPLLLAFNEYRLKLYEFYSIKIAWNTLQEIKVLWICYVRNSFESCYCIEYTLVHCQWVVLVNMFDIPFWKGFASYVSNDPRRTEQFSTQKDFFLCVFSCDMS